jgi:hypothetical protein
MPGNGNGKGSHAEEAEEAEGAEEKQRKSGTMGRPDSSFLADPDLEKIGSHGVNGVNGGNVLR